MKNLHINLITALLTFGVSVSICSVWLNSESVDERLSSAIRATYLFNAEKSCKNRRIDAVRTADEPNPNYRVKAPSDEQCEKMRQNSIPSPDIIARDISNVNKGCAEDNLSAAQCTARKEETIKDIEQNLLNPDINPR